MSTAIGSSSYRLPGSSSSALKTARPGGEAAASDLLQFVDEVDEEGQRQEGQRHEGHRRADVAVEHAAHGLHARAARAAPRTKLQHRRMVAPPEQRQRQHEYAAVQRGEGRGHAVAAAGHPGLGQVDEVEVAQRAEQRQHQVPVVRAARVDMRQADGQQHRLTAAIIRPKRQTSSPWFFKLGSRIRARVAIVFGGCSCARRSALMSTSTR